MMQTETDMVDKNGTDTFIFSQSLQYRFYLIPFCFKLFLHLAGNIVLGMVAGHEHERT